MPKLEFSDVASFMDALESRCSTNVYPGSEAYRELHQAVDDLCILYLGATEDQRAQIRDSAANLPSTVRQQLLNHIGWTAEQTRSYKDGEWVRKGLAAASIENNSLDYRDMFRELGGLYLAASNAGVNPSQYFRKAADLSSTRQALLPSVGSMRDFLANFEQSVYFEQECGQ